MNEDKLRRKRFLAMSKSKLYRMHQHLMDHNQHLLKLAIKLRDALEYAERAKASVIQEARKWKEKANDQT